MKNGSGVLIGLQIYSCGTLVGFDIQRRHVKSLEGSCREKVWSVFGSMVTVGSCEGLDTYRYRYQDFHTLYR